MSKCNRSVYKYWFYSLIYIHRFSKQFIIRLIFGSFDRLLFLVWFSAISDHLWWCYWKLYGALRTTVSTRLIRCNGRLETSLCGILFSGCYTLSVIRSAQSSPLALMILYDCDHLIRFPCTRRQFLGRIGEFVMSWNGTSGIWSSERNDWEITACSTRTPCDQRPRRRSHRCHFP